MNNNTLPILITFLIIEVIAILFFWKKNHYFYIYDTLVIMSTYISIFIIENKYKFRIPNYVKVLVAVTFISHNVFGELLGFYQGIIFDKILHLFGSFSLTILLFSLLKKIYDIKIEPMSFVFFYVTILGISVGTLFEILEFSLDQLFGLNHQHGLIDTNIDLIADIFGATFAGYWIWKDTM